MPSRKEIYRVYDEYGPILVFEDSNKRYLSFSQQDEQSCQLKSDPFYLQYDYSQAMLLVLLFCKPSSMILFGLGGGTLVTTLHQYLPNLKIDVVELRPKVVDVAGRFFQLPPSDRINTIINDAGAFLDRNERAKVDVLFSDIYGEEGLDLQQTEPWFIESCANLIKDDGWLVLNCWKYHRSDRQMRTALQAHFEDVRGCVTTEGNWVILAGKRASDKSEGQLKNAAKKWSECLGYSLGSSLSRLESLK